MIDTKELREKITIKGLDVVADTDILVVLDRLEAWENVFGHLGTPDEVGNEWRALSDRLEAAESECLEQARLNGMGSEREAALMAKLEAAERERDDLRAKVEQMEKQEPVGKIVAFGESLHEPSWRAGRLPPLMTELYALPGAKGEEK